MLPGLGAGDADENVVQRRMSQLEVMDPAGPWRLELDVPENRLGHILKAQEKVADGRLPEAPADKRNTDNLSDYLEKFIAIEKEEESIRKSFIISSWKQMSRNKQFVFNKLITGAFRIRHCLKPIALRQAIIESLH